MKKLLIALFLSTIAYAQSVQQSIDQLGQSNNWVLAFRWTAGGGGSVPSTPAKLGSCCQGYLITQVETVPGSPAPTGGYSVQITDAAGVDTLAGAAASLSASVAQSFAASNSAPPVQGALNLLITGQSVAGAQGVVYVFLSKPGMVNTAKLGTGSITSSPNWLTIANPPFTDARIYNFAAQTPGGSISIGANTVTLRPCPLGVNGADTGHYLYLTGGTGTAEAVLITGGTCAGGSSGTVIFTASNSHTGAWTVTSASAGIQETICSFSSAGGSVIDILSVTLRASVSACGKTSPGVSKLSGATFTGSFTVLGTLSAGDGTAEYFGQFSALNNFIFGDYANYAISTYLPAIYPSGVTTRSVQGTEFTGNGVDMATYNGFTALSASDMPLGNVVGGWMGAVCRNTTGVCFGSNILALSNGATNPRLVGLEIDVEPAAGVNTQGGSAGLYINGFNSAIHGAAIAIGAVNGGLFNNGIGISGIATAGAGLFVNGGASTMNSFINTTTGTFGVDAILLGSQQGVSFANTTSGFARVYNDNSNNLRIVPGASGNVSVRNATDSSTTGTLAGGTLQFNAAQLGTINYVTDNGANNAIACAVTGPALVAGLTVTVQLAHTLQAGANTFAYAGGSALAIKSHFNTANNIATAYAATGVITLTYNSPLWLDTAQ